MASTDHDHACHAFDNLLSKLDVLTAAEKAEVVRAYSQELEGLLRIMVDTMPNPVVPPHWCAANCHRAKPYVGTVVSASKNPGT
jgi:hypothetical protein